LLLAHLHHVSKVVYQRRGTAVSALRLPTETEISHLQSLSLAPPSARKHFYKIRNFLTTNFSCIQFVIIILYMTRSCK
jgi:hypothetical protein